MKKLVFSMAIAIVAFGCQKEVKSSEKPGLKTNYNNEKTLISGFVNPYDYGGEIHNKCLDESSLSKTYGSLDDNTKLSFMDSIVLREMNIRNIPTDQKVHTFNFPSSFFFKIKTLTPDQHYESLLNNMPVNQRNYFILLREKLNTYFVTNSLELTMIAVNTIEAAVNIDLTLSTDDKAFVLGAIAVGKHSFEYWVNNPGPQNANVGDGVWKADIEGFRDGFSDPSQAQGNFFDRFRNGWRIGSYYSDEQRAD